MADDPTSAILFPYAHAAFERARQAGLEFAYYTTAETAYRIISNKAIWMRSTQTMNDSKEIEHGRDCILAAIGQAGGRNLAVALDSVHPRLFDRTLERYRAWLPGFMVDTFVTCFSEHKHTEDTHGRLSMWRAYGGDAGVALILEAAPILRTPAETIGVYSSPVAYMDADQMSFEMQQVADRVVESSERLRTFAAPDLENRLFGMLRFATVCTKHPGFHEEVEWRVVASPLLEGPRIADWGTEVIRGIPQNVLKLKLEDRSDLGLDGLSIGKLIKRVIVGPTSQPRVVRRALHGALKAAGVDEPTGMIVESGIPLRRSI